MLRAFVSLVAVGLLAVSAASQDLDGVWYKVKVTTKGVTAQNILLLGGDPGIEVKKGKFKTTAYILFVFNEDEGGGGGTYGTGTVTPDGKGGWQFSDEDEFDIISDELLVNGFLGFVTDAGSVGSLCTLQLKNKYDKEDALKSSKLTSFGGLIGESALFLPGGDLAEGGGFLPFYGEMKVKGKSVPESKLPFDPMEVLEGGMLKSISRNTSPQRGFDAPEGGATATADDATTGAD